MVKWISEFEYLYCVLENKIIIFKVRRSKVTDYAALTDHSCKILYLGSILCTLPTQYASIVIKLRR